MVTQVGEVKKVTSAINRSRNNKSTRRVINFANNTHSSRATNCADAHKRRSVRDALNSSFVK